MNVLDDYLSRAAEALGVSDAWSPADRDPLLELTRDVAHGVARPAAPLAAYLAGVAVGRGLTPAEAAARLRALSGGTPPDG